MFSVRDLITKGGISMNYHYTVPDKKKIRLIVNTDAKNEADDQYAIVHALLTPKFDIKRMIAAHFGTRNDHTMEDSYEELKKLLPLMGMEGQVDIYRGAKKAIPDESTPEMSEGAD